jgi:hypothetical protein
MPPGGGLLDIEVDAAGRSRYGLALPQGVDR